MNLKKIAVAGLAVVGMAGVVGAQSPVTQEIKNNVPTGTMEASYNVAYEASMVVTPKTFSDNALLAGDISSAATAPGGNMGQIVIKTNYPSWDVEINAVNRLKLKKGNPPPPGAWNPQPSQEAELMYRDPKGTPGTPADNTADPPVPATPASPGLVPCKLSVYIGIVQGSSFAAGTYADFTQKLETDGKAAFSTIIGESLAAASKDYNSQAGNGIKTEGFVTPSADQVTFFVNGSLGKPEEVEIRGNEEGLYRETLIFTMVAGF